jgi:hypothetical protein
MTGGSVALAVLLLALGVRLAVPGGSMPMRYNNATLLTLCSGDGPMMLGHHRHDASGQAVDRGLPPGMGTTDAILGAYQFGNLPHDFAYILQAQGEVALNEREGYRPGGAVTLSAGLHHEHWRGITPQLQLNFRAAVRDHGVESDRPNSGGEQLYLAPRYTASLGLTYRM